MEKTTQNILIGLAITSVVVGGAIVVYKLRKPKAGSSFKKKLIKTTLKEWEDWNKNGQLKEGDSKTMPNLRKYWKEGANTTTWSDKAMIDTPWSAAFISWVMKKSGAGNDFKYSRAHSVYIRDAIENRKANNSNPFKGYKPKEKKVEVGDLVCFARKSGYGYDSKGDYPSHCDLVVSVKDNNAVTIGGNMSNTVRKTDVRLDNKGKVDESKYFVIIKNEK